jgi:hypothetical protein
LGRRCEDRPTAVLAVDRRFAQHAAHQGAAAPPAARTGADSGTLANLLEGFRPGLDRFEHGAPADFIADASRFEVLDNRLLPRALFQLVDGD